MPTLCSHWSTSTKSHGSCSRAGEGDYHQRNESEECSGSVSIGPTNAKSERPQRPKKRPHDLRAAEFADDLDFVLLMGEE